MGLESAPADWDDLGDRLAAQSIASGGPTGWFDRLYAAGAAGEVSMPWSRRTPHPGRAGRQSTRRGQPALAGPVPSTGLTGRILEGRVVVAHGNRS
jgi:hypothetical protein